MGDNICKTLGIGPGYIGKQINRTYYLTCKLGSQNAYSLYIINYRMDLGKKLGVVKDTWKIWG